MQATVYRPHLLATDERNEKSGSLSPIDLRDKNDINESLCLTLKVLKHEGRHDSNDLNRDQITVIGNGFAGHV